MKKILICPGERRSVAFLAESAPLVNVPILGEAIIEYWMDFLAASRVKEVLVSVTDRPEMVQSLVEDGTRWGLKVTVVPELYELSPAEAFAKYCLEQEYATIRPEVDIVVIDHLPGLQQQSLFSGYAAWYEATQAWLPRAPRMNRLGIREISPGVWVGSRSQIASTAQLIAPCWIGANVRIGHNVTVGPGAVLEDRVVVESTSEIVQGVVGQDTFVGSLTKVQDSIALGSTLINWRNGSCTQVADSFLLCSLKSHQPSRTVRPPETVENDKPFLLRSWEFLGSAKAMLLR